MSSRCTTCCVGGEGDFGRNGVSNARGAFEAGNTLKLGLLTQEEVRFPAFHSL
jgi:hypothetical protein